ncbi:hypothetical protein BD413DRAFT_220551 [Trametes elegans]|nr:hypothetical protein BD413DRAFT_220551 [Trametes elegans]
MTPAAMCQKHMRMLALSSSIKGGRAHTLSLITATHPPHSQQLPPTIPAMSANTETIPKSLEEFQGELDKLLSGLDRTIPGGPGNGEDREISDEELAKFLLENSDDKAEGRAFADVGRAQAAFVPVRRLEVSKSGSAQRFFVGNTVDSWSGQSRFGGLAYLSTPSTAAFYAVNGIKIPYVPLKLLIIFFYNTQQRKFAVYVGNAVSGDLKYTSGQGSFNGF